MKDDAGDPDGGMQDSTECRAPGRTIVGIRRQCERILQKVSFSSQNSDLTSDLSERVREPSRAFTPKIIFLSLAVVVLLSWAVPYNDYYLNGTYLTGNHLPLGAVFLLTILILLINPTIGRLSSHLRFNVGELVVVWSVMIVCSGIPSSGLSRYFYSLLVGPAYYANPQNQWEEHLLPYLDDRLVPSKDSESDVVKYFYESLPEDEDIPWAAWQQPLMYWSIFIVSFLVLMWTMCVILRKQWVEGERLNFPLVYLPLEMAATPEKGKVINAFFRSHYTWIGFGLPVFVHLLNGLQVYFPDVPRVTLLFQLRPLFQEFPWNAMFMSDMRIYLSAIAFVYLLPLDVSFSLWFFYLFLRFELMSSAIAGIPLGGDWNPFAVHQQAGAFLVLAVLLLWRARRHLLAVFKKAFVGADEVDDSEEAMSYRTAVFALLAAVIVMVGWCAYFGMSIWFSLLAVLFLMAILLVLTRLIAQGGLLFIYQNFSPYDLLATTFGTSMIGPATLGLLAIQNIVFIHDSREVMMPSVLNSLRISESTKVKTRGLLALVAAALVVCIVCSGYFFLKQTYTHGGSNLDWFGMRSVFSFKLTPFIRLAENETGPNWENIRYMVYGAVLMTFIFVMGGHYHWWPFHPLGLLMANSFALQHFWFSFMAGWALKWAIMKFGGGRSYRLMRYFFMGAVVGECTIGGIWIIVSFITGEPSIRILPG